MTTNNLRAQLDWRGAYHTINREERNLAAILYHVLLINDNLPRFLQAIDSNLPIVQDELAIYYEYALLRDLWHQIDRKAKTDLLPDQHMRNLILQLLPLSESDMLRAASIEQFNAYFGAVPKPSRTVIQAPSTWSMLRFSSTMNTTDFSNACMLKWAFKAKPDLVIHTAHDAALCIEAKYESGEGYYPVLPAEVRTFKERTGRMSQVRQTEVQRYLMEDVLGLQTQHIMVRQKRASDGPPRTFIWYEVFEMLDRRGLPPFVCEWIERLKPEQVVR